MNCTVKINGRQAHAPVLDCSRFNSDVELTESLVNGPGLMVLDGDPDNEYYRKMNQENVGQVYRIGDRVMRSADFLKNLGMDGMDGANDKATVVGVKYLSRYGIYLYTCDADDGSEWVYEWYQLERVK